MPQARMGKIHKLKNKPTTSQFLKVKNQIDKKTKVEKQGMIIRKQLKNSIH